MYDRFGSPQWIFDRCLEANSIFLPLTFLVSLALFFYIISLIKKSEFKRLIQKTRMRQILGAGLIGVGFIGIFLIVFFLGIIIGFSYCSAGSQFWPGVSAAHKVHAKIKYVQQIGKGLPKNQEELSRLDPLNYELVVANAKTEYIYDQFGNSYTWFVRPSAYHVAVFGSESDYALYRFSKIFYVGRNLQVYPPSYQGPWDQLPQ